MDGDGGDPVQDPLPGFAAASLSYQGPLPLPAHLQGYEDVQAGFAERIMAMAETAHNASVQARLLPVRAEATALLLSTTAVAFFPWVAFGAAVVLVINGQEVAGIITGLAGAISAGPQIIAATRKPRPVQRPTPPTAPSKPTKKRKK